MTDIFRYFGIFDGYFRQDYTLVKFAWDKARVVATVKASHPASTPVYQASFMPNDPQIVCVCGHNLFRFFRIQESTFKVRFLTEILDDFRRFVDEIRRF